VNLGGDSPGSGRVGDRPPGVGAGALSSDDSEEEFCDTTTELEVQQR